MRSRHIAELVLGLACFTAGCAGNIELVGYGTRPGIQHGLKLELLGDGSGGASLRIENTSDDIVSVNQSPLAMEVSVKRREGEERVPVQPCERIMIHMRTTPQPDDFVILAPRQTRVIPIPLSYEADRCRTLDRICRLEKGRLYEVEVRLLPYFGSFTETTADRTLTEFKIPNYLREPLAANAMTLRAR